MFPRKGRTLLLVDDDPDTRDVLSRIVERAGIRCIVAPGGVDALCILQTEAAQVILADYDMPVMDGVELLRLVAQRHPFIGRLMLTGRKDAQPAVRAINLGQIHRYLTKPCRASDLLTTLHFAFEAAETETDSRDLLASLRREEALLNEVRKRLPGVVEEIEQRPPFRGVN